MRLQIADRGLVARYHISWARRRILQFEIGDRHSAIDASGRLISWNASDSPSNFPRLNKEKAKHKGLALSGAAKLAAGTSHTSYKFTRRWGLVQLKA